MRLAIEEEARNDADNVAAFYDDSEPGGGLYFLQRLRESAKEMVRSAGTHSKRFGFHFCMITKFPVAMYYRKDGEVVRLCAILDCRRNPRWIRRQLKGR